MEQGNKPTNGRTVDSGVEAATHGRTVGNDQEERKANSRKTVKKGKERSLPEQSQKNPGLERGVRTGIRWECRGGEIW